MLFLLLCLCVFCLHNGAADDCLISSAQGHKTQLSQCSSYIKSINLLSHRNCKSIVQWLCNNKNPEICCEEKSDNLVEPVSSLSTPCQTSHNTSGFCRLIDHCYAYNKICLNPPISISNISVLANSRCGQSNGKPTFCCPSDEMEIGTRGNFIEKDDVLPNSPFLASLDECAQFIEERIYQGKNTSLDEFPWIALLMDTNGKPYCQGVLIGRRYVLTSAHCLPNKNSSENVKLSNVRLGEHNLNAEIDCLPLGFGEIECNEPTQNIPVEEIIVHPDWSATNNVEQNDIGLIRLQQDAVYSESVSPICLPNIPNKINIVTEFASGWTRPSDAFNSSSIKEKTKLIVVNDDECSKSAGNVSTRKSICVKYNNDFCKYYSGGPMFGYDVSLDGWFALGIGPAGLCQQREVLFVTNTTNYIDWIVSNLKA